MEGGRKKFSAVGMRVLAVDDNLTCLKVLEAMLRKCEYHVTTSNQAVEALKMLRENKDKFDLIITDVHMPDMDGFKLLELVGLEMDLPVIMLSANGDREFVMKGVTHGACDYLLKPVRMEQLKNIWQHVARKMNSAVREQNRSNNAAEGQVTSGSSEHKQSRKREDRNEEGEDSDENSDDIGSATGQKKARVKWSGDMHRKFVAAVNQLGIDKAQPKTILKLMNVEGLRRQNIGSHLQKYRLALRKMASKEESKSSVEGVRGSYLPLAMLDNYRNFQPFTSSNQLSVLPSVQYNGAMRRRQPTLLGYNSVSPGIPQAARTFSTRCLLSGLLNITGTQQENFLQRIPATMEVSQLQLHRRIQEADNNFPGSVSANSVMNNPLMLQSQQNSMNAGNSSRFPERFNETLQSVDALVGCSANTVPVNVGFSPSFSQMNSNPMDFSLSSSLVAPLSDLVTGNALDMQNGLFSECSRYMTFGSDQQQWAECIQVHAPIQNNVFSSINPPLAGQFIGDVISQSQRVNSGIFDKKPANINGQMNYSTMYLPQQCKTDKPIAENQVKYKDEFFLEASTLQGRLSSGGYGLDEIVMTKSGFVDV